jgi:transmembrane sensor
MSQERTIGGLNHQISEEAAEWLVEFRTGPVSASVRKEFDAWVRASPEHLRAFIEMAVLWRESGALDPQRRLDVEELIERDRRDSKLVDLTSYRAAGEGTDSMVHRAAGRPTRGVSRAGWMAVAATLFGALVGGSLFLQQVLSGRTYSTDVGERRSVTLPDGSKVLLDSRSTLRVHFTAAARQVELVRGQALFAVIHDPRKPFLVRAGGTVIRDVGTQFDVKQRPEDTVVTVVEGRVAVDAREPVFVSAGEQVDVPAGNFSPQPVRVSVGSVVAWTRDQVVLDSATLAEAAKEFNLYSNRRIVAQDLGASPLRLSGVFVTNPDFLLRYLRERPDISITETDSEIDITRNPGK